MLTQTFNALDGIVVPAGQGESYWVLGDLYTFKVLGEDTNGMYSLLELVIQPQDGTPPHIHSREAESFYIQSGSIEFQVDDQIVTATAGTFLYSPPGQLHSFRNITSTPARMLCWAMPAGVEKFFMEIGTRADDPMTPPPPVTAEDIEKVVAIAPKYGITILPPPDSTLSAA